MTKPPPTSLKIRMSESLRAKLEQAAQHHRTSLNGEIVRRLEESVDLTRPDPSKLFKELVPAITRIHAVRDKLAASQHIEDALELTSISDRLAHMVFGLFGVAVRGTELHVFDEDTMLSLKGNDQ